MQNVSDLDTYLYTKKASDFRSRNVSCKPFSLSCKPFSVSCKLLGVSCKLLCVSCEPFSVSCKMLSVSGKVCSVLKKKLVRRFKQSVLKFNLELNSKYTGFWVTPAAGWTCQSNYVFCVTYEVSTYVFWEDHPNTLTFIYFRGTVQILDSHQWCLVNFHSSTF